MGGERVEICSITSLLPPPLDLSLFVAYFTGERYDSICPYITKSIDSLVSSSWCRERKKRLTYDSVVLMT